MYSSKTKYNTTGYKINCINYHPCPLCYGCRAYTPIMVKCNKCEKNKKRDICNTELHTDGKLSKMITKERIEINTGGIGNAK